MEKINRIINNLHWGLLIFFIVGYFATKKYFSFAGIEYFSYNLLAFVACAILLVQLKGFQYRNVAVWLGLITLVTVYFLRAYWIILDPAKVKDMLPWSPYFAMLERKDLLLFAFKLSTVMFVFFSIVCALLLYASKNITFQKLILSNTKVDAYKRLEKILFTTLPFVMMVMYLLIHHFQIGLMGAPPGDSLPFRLRGMIFYSAFVFVPLFIVLLINLAEELDHKLISNLGILLMIMHGIIMMFLRGSRSSLLLSILLLIFLVLIGGLRLERNQKIFIGAFALMALFMIPLMSIFRNLRNEHEMMIFNALIHSFDLVQINLVESMLKGLTFIFFRIPGIESLWCMLAQSAFMQSQLQPLNDKVFEIFTSLNGITGYLTYDIYHILPTANNLLAPSFVGWFYLVAGLPAAALGGALAGFFAVIGWIVTSKKYLKSWVVAQTFLLWIFFVALTEGTLDTMGLLVLSGIVCIVFIETILGLLTPPKT